MLAVVVATIIGQEDLYKQLVSVFLSRSLSRLFVAFFSIPLFFSYPFLIHGSFFSFPLLHDHFPSFPVSPAFLFPISSCAPALSQLPLLLHHLSSFSPPYPPFLFPSSSFLSCFFVSFPALLVQLLQVAVFRSPRELEGSAGDLSVHKLIPSCPIVFPV